MADRNMVMINFRLNLSKREDREIYDYIQQFDSTEFKVVLKGGKSNFIKTVLLSYIRGIKQEQEATKALVEQKTQNEKLVEMIGAMLNESQGTLFQILSELVEKVVLAALEGKVLAHGNAIKDTIASSNTIAENGNDVEVFVKAGNDTGVLPEVSNELPDDALDYFSEL